MNLYEKHVESELARWHGEMIKEAGFFARASKGVQDKTRKLVPKRVQDAVTSAVETTVKAVLSGSEFLSIKEETNGLSLAERDYLVLELFQSYLKTAVSEGVAFGAGGVLLGLADLPAFLSIKIKFLFDCAKLYGFDPKEQSERLFILYVFQLAFSGQEHRLFVFDLLQNWGSFPQTSLDWEKFQIEYRDFLDVAKLLQLLPVVGSIAGGAANFKLMNRLKENAMNAYRMRLTGKRWESGRF
jgi:hypothetical protein